MKMVKKIVFILMLFSICILGCKKEDTLKPLEKDFTVGLTTVNLHFDFCTVSPEKAKSLLKFIYVMDKSRSNQLPGTDTDGRRRYDPIIEFLNTGMDDDTIFYSLLNFSSNVSTISPFVHKDEFEVVIRNQRDRVIIDDQGWTHYGSALDLIENMIRNDVLDAQGMYEELITSHYVIFFLSDGRPTNAAGEELTDTEVTNNILPKVKNILALKNNVDLDFDKWIESIKFHTGYYYTSTTYEASAEFTLNRMAVEGEGDAFKFEDNEAVELNKFTLPERNVKRALKDIYVINANTVWEGNVLKLDSDGDGISDEMELNLGSDPQKYDSDGNGVSDGVEFKITGKPCAELGCPASGANPFHSCLQYIRKDWSESNGGEDKFLDSDRDLLNDCEEAELLNTNIYKFDTTGDWVPDYLAFRSGGAISYTGDSHLTGKLLDPDSDGLNNYFELKMNTPWGFHNERGLNVVPYRYFLKPTGEFLDRSCFQLKVEDISVFGMDNLLRIFILEKSAIIDDRRFMRVINARATSKDVFMDIRSHE